VLRRRSLQQKRWPTVVANQLRDFLPCRKVAIEVTQDVAGAVLPFDGVLRRLDSPGDGIKTSGLWLAGVVEQRRED
jgi:hypothetical protein